MSDDAVVMTKEMAAEYTKPYYDGWTVPMRDALRSIATGATVCIPSDELARLLEDAAIGAKWRENSSLSEWFPFTAQEIDRLRVDSARWRYCLAQTMQLHPDCTAEELTAELDAARAAGDNNG